MFKIIIALILLMMKLIHKCLLTLLFLFVAKLSLGQTRNTTLTLNIDLIKQAYDSTKITYIKGSLPKNSIERSRYLRIQTHKGKIIRGYITAFNKDGLFIINKDNTYFSYCDYKNIKAIYFGRSYGNWVATATAGVAGIATLASLGSRYAILYGFLGALTTASYGQVGIALSYGIYKSLNHCHWRINYKRKAGTLVTEYILENKHKFGHIQNVDSITHGLPDLKKDNQIEIQDSSKNEIVKLEEQTELPIKVEQPKVNARFLEGLSFEVENAISIQWMLKNFNSKSVNESTLMKSFKNIKGLQITPEQLLNLNHSSLQFLAIIIGESAGYDIKALLELTDKQRKEIAFYEPSIFDTVSIQSTIDKSYLSELDLQNLQIIYNELNGRAK